MYALWQEVPKLVYYRLICKPVNMVKWEFIQGNNPNPPHLGRFTISYSNLSLSAFLISPKTKWNHTHRPRASDTATHRLTMPKDTIAQSPSILMPTHVLKKTFLSLMPILKGKFVIEFIFLKLSWILHFFQTENRTTFMKNIRCTMKVSKQTYSWGPSAKPS